MGAGCDSVFVLQRCGWMLLVLLMSPIRWARSRSSRSMVGADALRGLVQSLDVVDVFDVGGHEVAPRLDRVLGVSLLGMSSSQAAPNPARSFLGHDLDQPVRGAVLQRAVSFRDSRFHFRPGRFQPRIRGSFPGAMNAHERLEEELVGQLAGLCPFCPHPERPRKGGPNLALGMLRHPLQDGSDIFLFQRRFSVNNDRTVHGIAMRARAQWED